MIRPQERIGHAFIAQQGWDGGNILSAHVINLCGPGLEVLIVGFNGQGKPGIGLGVFMGAINLGVIGQGGKFRKG